MNENLDRRTLKLIATANQLIKDYAYTGLDDTYKAVRAAILDVGEITSVKKLRQLERAIQEAVKANIAPRIDDMTGELYDISELEAAFYVGLANEAIKADDLAVKVSTPASERIRRYVEGSVIKLNSKSGNTVVSWAEYAEMYERSVSDKIKSVIRSAWLSQNQGSLQSPNAIVKQVKTINDEINRRNAESMVRTAVNHFGTQGRLAFADDNQDVIEREVPIVTFDSRVSDTCISISANYGQNGWPYGKSPVGYPPYHYGGCRTQIGFLLQGQNELFGTRQSVGGRKGEEAEESFDKRQKRSDKVIKYRGKSDKAFKAEQIPANTPIAKFLRDQPRWYVEEVLGKKKADAFLNGELSLGKLTDADLKPRTVEQLGID